MITSTKNQQIKNIIALQSKVKERQKQGLYIVEGRKMMDEVPLDQLEKVFCSESYYDHIRGTRFDELDCEIVKDSVFEQISDTKTPQGVLGIVKVKTYTINDVLSKKHPLLLVLEDIQDPGNVGTIFRTAEGAGVDGILLSSKCVDVYNPKVVRSTMGSIFRVPFLRTDHLIKELDRLKEQGIQLCAAHLKGQSYHDEVAYDASGIALLIGNEGNGLTEETAEKADIYVKIPLYGQVESLNASIAASVLMYEAERQRRNKKDRII